MQRLSKSLVKPRSRRIANALLEAGSYVKADSLLQGAAARSMGQVDRVEVALDWLFKQAVAELGSPSGTAAVSVLLHQR